MKCTTANQNILCNNFRLISKIVSVLLKLESLTFFTQNLETFQNKFSFMTLHTPFCSTFHATWLRMDKQKFWGLFVTRTNLILVQAGSFMVHLKN